MRTPAQLFPLVLLPVLLGCAPMNRTRLVYSMPLVSVQRPEDVAQRWGDYVLERPDTGGVTYSDKLVQIAAVPNRGSFILLVKNLSPHTIRLIWDEMAYVGPGGVTSRVASDETRIIDLNRSQPPTVIPSGAAAAMTAIPVSLIQKTMSGYEIQDFFPPGITCEEAEGAEVSLLVPIQIRDTVNEYRLVFALEDLTIIRDAVSGVQRTVCPPDTAGMM